MNLLFLDLSPAYIPFLVQCTKAAGDKVNPTVDNLIVYEEGGTDATFDSTTITGSPFDPVQINSKTGLWGVLIAKSALTAGKFYLALWEMTVDGITTAKIERFFACNASQFKADVSNLDVAVSSRFATSGYTAPDNAGISAIKTVTDKFLFDSSNFIKSVQQGAVDILQTAADKVWGSTVRTLTSFGTLIADIWNYVTRTLTSGGGGGGTVIIYPLEVIGVKDGYGDIRDPIKLIKGETKTKWYQLKSETTGEALDITNYTFKLAVKGNYRNATYLIEPFNAEKDIPNKKFGFVFTSTKTANTVKGVFEIAMYDNSNPAQKTVLTPPGGVQFGIYDDIIDT